ncbi:RidA family protein [Hoeflea sp.]|uniref:RidA family protein n=1 Tax=Hoeflea sp. TaxID=1940281 RepID=UPI003B01CD26
MKLKSLVPQKIAAPFGRYAHGARISGFGSLLQTSGQLGVETDGSIPATVKQQAEICFANIDAILAEGEMRREDIFHITAFVTEREHMAEYMAARDAYLADVTDLPASTLLIVTGFTRPEFKVEIQVTAAR